MSKARIKVFEIDQILRAVESSMWALTIEIGSELNGDETYEIVDKDNFLEAIKKTLNEQSKD